MKKVIFEKPQKAKSNWLKTILFMLGLISIIILLIRIKRPNWNQTQIVSFIGLLIVIISFSFLRRKSIIQVSIDTNTNQLKVIYKYPLIKRRSITIMLAKSKQILNSRPTRLRKVEEKILKINDGINQITISSLFNGLNNNEIEKISEEIKKYSPQQWL